MPGRMYSLVTYTNTIVGGKSPSSAPYNVTAPVSDPTLTSVRATSPTAGTATAIPPPGVTYTKYTFTVAPLNGGGSPITVNSNSPTAAIPGLTPGTQARTSCQMR